MRIVTTIEPRYDERGRLLGEWITNPRQGQAGEPAMMPLRRVEYFADNAAVGSRGKIRSEIHYFGAGVSLPNPPQGVDGVLTGRLSQVVQYSYDAEGRVRVQERFGQSAMPVAPSGTRPNPVLPDSPWERYEDAAREWWSALAPGGSAHRTIDGASAAATLTLLSRTHYHFDPNMPAPRQAQSANGRLTRYANEVLALGFGEKAADHFDDNTGFRPYVQYHEIRGYAGTGGGWQEDWVVGNRFDGTYNASYRIPYTTNDDADTTVSRLFDAFGRVSHQYEYLDIPGTQRKNQHRVRGYAYNADGQVISRKDYSAIGADRNWAPETVMPERRFVISNGQQVAELTIGAPARNDDPAIEGLQQLAGSTPYRAGGGQVSVQSGETLSMVAQRVYGNSSYWYVLADANGVGSPDEALVPGTLLDVPSVGVSRNSADTFKPYDASEALGPSTPVLPYIAPSPNSCGAVGQLIMVVVAVIATIYTAGAAAGAMSSLTGAVGGLTAAGASTFGVGMAALSGGLGFSTAAIGAAAIGGAVGSIASQGVGMLTGNVQSFSWRSVAAGAVGAGITAGIGSVVGNVGTAVQSAMKGTGSWGSVAKAAGAHALGGAASNALSGRSFSWRGVAANAVGSVLSATATNGLFGSVQLPGGTGAFATDFATGLVGGIVTAHTRKAFGVGGVNEGEIALDALGNAIGNAGVRQLGAWEQSRIDRTTARIQGFQQQYAARADEAMQRHNATFAEKFQAEQNAQMEAQIAGTADRLMADTAEKMAARGIPMPSMAPLKRSVAAVAAERARLNISDAWWNELGAEWNAGARWQPGNRFARRDRQDEYVAMRREEQRLREAPQIAAQQYDRSPDRLMPGEFRTQWSDWQPVPKGDVGQWATLLGFGANVAVSNSGKYELLAFGKDQNSHLNYVVSADGDDWYTPIGYFDLLSYGELKAEGMWTGMDKPKTLGASGGVIGRLTLFSGSERLGKSDWRLDYRAAQVYELTADAGLQVGSNRSESRRLFNPEASASARVSAFRTTASLGGGRFDLGPLLVTPAGELQGDLGSMGGIVRTNNRFYGTGWRTQGRVGLSAAVGGAVTWDVDVQLNQEWISRNSWWLRHAVGGGR